MPSAFSPDRLTSSLLAIPIGDWSAPSSYSATKVHHGYRQYTLVLSTHPQTHHFDWVLEQFVPVWGAWLSWIEPGGFIIPHQDAGPYRERWQVPIQPAGEFTFGSGEVGIPLRVEQWQVHSVWNTTAGPRIHLVIDRDIVDHHPWSEFATYPERITPPHRHLVEAASG